MGGIGGGEGTIRLDVVGTRKKTSTDHGLAYDSGRARSHKKGIYDCAGDKEERISQPSWSLSVPRLFTLHEHIIW